MRDNTDNTYSKMLCLLNPEYFIKDILGYDLKPHHAKILQHIASNKVTLNLAPRGFGKSSIATIAYTLWKIAGNRNLRVLIVSSTATQAASFLREIRAQLEQNQKLINIFGEFVDLKKWTETEISIKGKTTVSKESSVSCAGANGSITGRHFDLILVDDVCDFENARTPTQRTKLSEWFRTSLLPSAEPHAQIIVVGTRYAPTDLYQELIDSNQYQVQIQKAILDDGQSLWPDKFPVELLQQKKSELGSLIFSLQFQNDITLARESNIFRYEWMQFYDVAPAGLRIVQGCDLAISQSDSSDYFVILTMGYDKADGRFYVLDLYRNRISFQQQLDTIKLKAQQWSPLSIAIESNAYQKALSGELIRTTSLPIRQITTVKDKVSRAQRRSALFENGKILLRKDMNILIDELCMLPHGAHDDTFDSLDMALTAYEKATCQQPQQFHFTKSIGRPGVRC